jgi:transcriptional regulator with XRE-family HTH domain
LAPQGLALPLVAMTIGEKLRKKRAELKLHQIELARLFGVSMVSISRWERDIGVIRASHMADILRFLD